MTAWLPRTWNGVPLCRYGKAVVSGGAGKAYSVCAKTLQARCVDYQRSGAADWGRMRRHYHRDALAILCERSGVEAMGHRNARGGENACQIIAAHAGPEDSGIGFVWRLFVEELLRDIRAGPSPGNTEHAPRIAHRKGASIRRYQDIRRAGQSGDKDEPQTDCGEPEETPTEPPQAKPQQAGSDQEKTSSVHPRRGQIGAG